MKLFKYFAPKPFWVMGSVFSVISALAFYFASVVGIPAQDQLKQVTGLITSVEQPQKPGMGIFHSDIHAERITIRQKNGQSITLQADFHWPEQQAKHLFTLPVTAGYYLTFAKTERVGDLKIGDKHPIQHQKVYQENVDYTNNAKGLGTGWAVGGGILLLIALGAYLSQKKQDGETQADAEFSHAVTIWAVTGAIFLSFLYHSMQEFVQNHLSLWLGGLPAGYIIVPAFFLVLLPWLPGFVGMQRLGKQAQKNGRRGKFGMLVELGESLISTDPVQRKTGKMAIWLFAYFLIPLILFATFV